MSGARTLVQLAGLPAAKLNLDESVLVVIDAQREYVDGLLPLEGVQPALDRIGKVLELMRARGVPVIHVQHQAPAGSGAPFDVSGMGYAFAEPSIPAPGEVVVQKTKPSSFYKTDLLERFEATGRKTMIFVGFMTHMCVSTTARIASHLDIPAFLIGDCAATRALPDPMGSEDVPAEVIHRAALAEINDCFATVISTADLV
ncbi:MAG: cysteine hydrolase family protein [Xanthobacter sp.]